MAHVKLRNLQKDVNSCELTDKQTRAGDFDEDATHIPWKQCCALSVQEVKTGPACRAGVCECFA